MTTAAAKPANGVASIPDLMPGVSLEPESRYRSAEIAQLVSALITVQGDIANPAKSHTNPHFQSSYADLADVLNVCRRPLADNGLCITQLPVGDHQAPFLRTILMHESGQWIASELPLFGDLSKPQVLGSTLTYMRRYALAAIVGIAQEDDDANGAQQHVQQSRQQPREGRRPPRQQSRQNQPSRQTETPRATPGDFASHLQDMIDQTENAWKMTCAVAKKPYKPLGAKGKALSQWQVCNGVVKDWIARKIYVQPNVETDGKWDQGKAFRALQSEWNADEERCNDMLADVVCYIERKVDATAKEVGINLDAQPAEEVQDAEVATA